jgi:hypothetical protein
MNNLRGCWKIFFILCILFLFTSGCVTQSPNKNVSLSPIYTAPIGGFVPTFVSVVEPNTTLEIDYIFYSRNWGPGQVSYTLDGGFSSEPQFFYIDPSSFRAEPGHIYKSHVFLNTSHFPDYKAPDLSNGGELDPSGINIKVSLEDNSTNFGDDSMFFFPEEHLYGPMSWNQLSIDNCSIIVKRGETKTFNISFIEDPKRGNIGKISLTSSKTPLNITITPSEYIAKHGLDFPSVVSIAADPSQVQGQYPLNITINGTVLDTMVHCRDTDAYIISGQGYSMPPISHINVTVV